MLITFYVKYSTSNSLYNNLLLTPFHIVFMKIIKQLVGL